MELIPNFLLEFSLQRFGLKEYDKKKNLSNLFYICVGIKLHNKYPTFFLISFSTFEILLKTFRLSQLGGFRPLSTGTVNVSVGMRRKLHAEKFSCLPAIAHAFEMQNKLYQGIYPFGKLSTIILMTTTSFDYITTRLLIMV